MTAEITGSITVIQTDVENSSQAVTAPADATLMLVFVSYYTASGNVDWDGFTYDGDALSAVENHLDSAFGNTTIWKRDNPSTGSNTFAWDIDSDTISEGANIFVIFLKNVDFGTNSIRDSGSGAHASACNTGALTSNDLDLFLFVGYSFSGTACDVTPTGAGQTEESAPAEYNSCYGAVGSKAGDSGGDTLYVEGDFCSVCGVSVAGTAATVTGAAALSGTGALTSIGTVISALVTGAVAMAGTGALTAEAILTVLGQTTLTGTGSLAATPSLFVLGDTTLTGAGTLAAVGEVVVLGNTTLSGAGDLSAVPSLFVQGQVAMAGTGDLSGQALLFVFGVVALAGTGDLSAIGEIVGVDRRIIMVLPVRSVQLPIRRLEL